MARKPREDTIEALVKRRNGSKLKDLALELGKPIGYAAVLSDVCAGREGVSQHAENELRLALGLPAIGTAEVPVCASCGGAHVALDCGGREVVRVVVLAPGEAIKRRPASKPPEDLFGYSQKTLAQLIRNRSEM